MCKFAQMFFTYLPHYFNVLQFYVGASLDASICPFSFIADPALSSREEYRPIFHQAVWEQSEVQRHGRCLWWTLDSHLRSTHAQEDKNINISLSIPFVVLRKILRTKNLFWRRKTQEKPNGCRKVVNSSAKGKMPWSLAFKMRGKWKRSSYSQSTTVVVCLWTL